MNIAELTRDNPRLLELKDAYRKLNLFDTSQWETFSRLIDIQNFRGEPGYLAQMWGGMTEQRYLATLDYAIRIGLRHDIETLGEDGAFGCITFNADMGANEDDIVISRDLLDSVFEIQFLKDTLGKDDLSLFDIGAGYGRFAHRFLQAFRGGFACCVDAVPLSTFLCDFYMSYRMGENYECWCSMPLTEVADLPFGDFPHLDIACNMYSFSEMPLSAVKMWLDLCENLEIKYFFLVPHAGDLINPHFVTSEPDGSHLDYYPLFERHGYKLKVQRPKFPVEMSGQLIYNTSYLLFERG